ncbi:metal-dependent hydrolase [Glutamicibacter ardleyensis]|uniref:metal-dependent hydrolase n=1 Tax=Glutamicibacter ardleyensis TaxID=225894 RepID=UPI003FD22131
MMGAHHAACGAGAWVALTSKVEIPLDLVTEKMGWSPFTLQLGLDLLDVPGFGVVLGALVCAGSALLPDADHHSATIAHSLPPVSNIMCRVLGKLSGGHRHGTHSILGILFFTLIAVAGSYAQTHVDGWGVVNIGAGIMSVILIAFACKALKIIPDGMRKSPWGIGLVFGALVAINDFQEPRWFAYCVTLGVIVHLLGDMLTTGGCNLVWPGTWKPPAFVRKTPLLNKCWMNNGYLAIPLLGNAGSWREWLLLVPISIYAMAGMLQALVATGQSYFD